MTEARCRRSGSPAARMTRLDVVMAALLLVAVGFALLPESWLYSSVIIDDALYYVKVPMNFVQSGRVTFDNQTLTNGFHPLWGAVMLLPALLGGGDSALVLRLALAVSVLVIGLGLWSVRSIGRSLGWGSGGTIAAMVVLFFPRADLWMSLMESALSMALLAALVAWCLRSQPPARGRSREALAMGLLCGATLLARLDFVFVVGSLVVAAFVSGWKRSGLRVALRYYLVAGVAAAATVVPYLLANYHHFGHLVPVSGRKKTVPGGVEGLITGVESMLGAVGNKAGVPVWTVAGAAALGMAGLVLLGLRNRKHKMAPKADLNGVMIALVLGTLIRFVYQRLAMSIESVTVPWYWVPEVLCVSLASGWAVASLAFATGRWRGWRHAGHATQWTLLALVFAGGIAYLIRDTRMGVTHQSQATYRMAQWARENLPPPSLGAMYDPGVFSYVSGLNVISMNGLISDNFVMECSLACEYGPILEKHKPDFLVDYYTKEQLASMPEGAVLHTEVEVDAPGGKGKRQMALLDATLVDTFRGPGW